MSMSNTASANTRHHGLSPLFPTRATILRARPAIKQTALEKPRWQHAKQLYKQKSYVRCLLFELGENISRGQAADQLARIYNFRTGCKKASGRFGYYRSSSASRPVGCADQSCSSTNVRVVQRHTRVLGCCSKRGANH